MWARSWTRFCVDSFFHREHNLNLAGRNRCKTITIPRTTLRPDVVSKGGTTANEGQSGLEAITGALTEAAAEGKGPPPVERWNPLFCGDLIT
jgi:hypothetical protein